MTLVELVIFIVVVGLGVAGILLVMNFTTGRSADPMVREQANLIAESYLEEILTKKFVDPSSNTVCPAPPPNRSNYDNVCDYNGLSNNGARDQFNNPVSGLEGYSVSAAVTGDGTVTLNNINNTGAVRVLRVDVTVTGPADTTVRLAGYRTNYNCYNVGDTGCRPL